MIQPLIDANSRLARSDFPDFNDPNKLGEGQAMVDRLTNLIGIFQKPELDFSRNRAEHDDIYAKMLKTNLKIAKARKQPYLRLEGCPVSVAEQALALVTLGGLKNPFLDPKQAITFNKGYVGWRGRVALHRVMGHKYQCHGSYQARGAARSELERDGDE